jgi:hypothetical protein
MQFFKAEKRKKPKELSEYHLFVLGSGTSQEALDLIDRISAEQLAAEYKLKIRRNCTLEGFVKHTLGTEFLIDLFDPSNGWMRDYTKRPDILKMTEKLIKKGVCIDGISFLEITIEKYIQSLIMKGMYGDDSTPAVLSEEIVKTFIENGYQFSYPEELYASSAAELAAKVIDNIEDKTKLPKPLLKIVASYYSDGILHARFFDSKPRSAHISHESEKEGITQSKP